MCRMYGAVDRYDMVVNPVQVFYFIRPSPANLAAYERWSGTEVQNHSWLGDMCDEVFKVELTTGNTMIIPTGWIHAVVSSFASSCFRSPLILFGSTHLSTR